MPSSDAPLIDDSHAAFMQGGVSIGVAASSRDAVPTLVRATRCRVRAARRPLTVFVSATPASPGLECIPDNGAISVVFSEPPTHRTVQIKGQDARVSGLSEGDLQLVFDYRNAFSRVLAPLGYDQKLVHTLLALPSADIVGISFTPVEAYSQTPGPNAGQPLARKA